MPAPEETTQVEELLTEEDIAALSGESETEQPVDDEVPEPEEVAPEEVAETVVPETPEPDAELLRVAKKMGFREDGELDAETYIFNANEVINSLKKGKATSERTMEGLMQEMTGLKTLVKKLSSDQDTRGTLEINRAIETLEAEAVEEFGRDQAQYEVIRSRIDKYKSMLPSDTPAPATATEPQPPVSGLSTADQATLDTWTDENEWYHKDVALQGAANAIDNELYDEHPTWSFKDRLGEVAKRMKRFTGERPATETPAPGTTPAEPVVPSVIDTSHRPTTHAAKTATRHDLDAGQRAAAEKWHRHGESPDMNINEYLDMYAKEQDKLGLIVRKK